MNFLKKPGRKISICVISSFVLFGCIVSNSRNTRRESDYSNFTPVNDNTGIYWNPVRKMKDYNAFFVAPVEVYPNPQSKASPDGKKIFEAWAEKFRQKSIDSLKDDYPLVDKPAKGVLTISISIVDIKPFTWLKKPDGTRYLRADTTLKGTRFDLGCVDSKTKELVFALTTRLGGENYMAYKNSDLLPKIDESFGEWLKLVRFMLDRSWKQPRHLEPLSPSPTPSK